MYLPINEIQIGDHYCCCHWPCNYATVPTRIVPVYPIKDILGRVYNLQQAIQIHKTSPPSLVLNQHPSKTGLVDKIRVHRSKGSQLFYLTVVSTFNIFFLDNKFNNDNINALIPTSFPRSKWKWNMKTNKSSRVK